MEEARVKLGWIQRRKRGERRREDRTEEEVRKKREGRGDRRGEEKGGKGKSEAGRAREEKERRRKMRREGYRYEDKQKTEWREERERGKERREEEEDVMTGLLKWWVPAGVTYYKQLLNTNRTGTRGKLLFRRSYDIVEGWRVEETRCRQNIFQKTKTKCVLIVAVLCSMFPSH